MTLSLAPPAAVGAQRRSPPVDSHRAQPAHANLRIAPRPEVESVCAVVESASESSHVSLRHRRTFPQFGNNKRGDHRLCVAIANSCYTLTQKTTHRPIPIVTCQRKSRSSKRVLAWPEITWSTDNTLEISDSLPDSLASGSLEQLGACALALHAHDHEHRGPL